jgi:quinol monooxygenase YgiN
MWGLIAKITLLPGRRDEMIEILKESTADMPGCLSYVVAKDAADENTIWVTEVWDSMASHDASLTLPAQSRTRYLEANLSFRISRGSPSQARCGEPARQRLTPISSVCDRTQPLLPPLHHQLGALHFWPAEQSATNSKVNVCWLKQTSCCQRFNPYGGLSQLRAQ